MIESAIKIVTKLQENGFEAYFAGGYVRDMLLEKEHSDVDIATSANPDEVESLFKNTRPIGKQFGIILVIEEDKGFEVATFRRESDYIDNRRPSTIHFTSAEVDAKRRDFTINGLFYDPIKRRVLDFVGGREDIKKKTVRFIGEADSRINEDHLRLVRAIRFKITLGFQYEKTTFDAVRNLSSLIRNVSVERLREELNKILSSPNRHQGLVELSESKILINIIPELESLKGVPQPIEYHHEGDVFTHTYLALKSLPPETPAYLALAVLLHDIGKPKTIQRIDGKISFHHHAVLSAQMAQEIMRRLKYSNVEINQVCYLVENHMTIGDIGKMRPHKRYQFVTDPRFKDLIELARADAAGTFPVNQELTEKLERYLADANSWTEEKKKQVKIDIINGDDLIKLGYRPGKDFKAILNEVNDAIIEGEVISHSQAVEFVKKRFPSE
jgi:poly(A) polymerase